MWLFQIILFFLSVYAQPSSIDFIEQQIKTRSAIDSIYAHERCRISQNLSVCQSIINDTDDHHNYNRKFNYSHQWPIHCSIPNGKTSWIFQTSQETYFAANSIQTYSFEIYSKYCQLITKISLTANVRFLLCDRGTCSNVQLYLLTENN